MPSIGLGNQKAWFAVTFGRVPGMRLVTAIAAAGERMKTPLGLIPVQGIDLLTAPGGNQSIHSETPFLSSS